VISTEIQRTYEDSLQCVLETGKRQFAPKGYERIIFTNGCFDLLHPGHIQLLRYCRENAGWNGAVVVGLNDDDSVRKLKGKDRPIMDVRSRALMLLATRFVDHVISFGEDTPIELIKALRPSAVVKGADYKISNVVGKEIAPVLLAPFDKGWSTSKLLEKLK
jgi:rfaE bifunctional protein nucleotidyltransferase chain/domain